MTTTEEHLFCEAKGDVVFFDMRTIIRKLLDLPNFSFNNIINAFTVAKECVLGNSDSWLVDAIFQEKPIVKTIPFAKRKPSEETTKLMIESYENSAGDDLAIAKELEGLECEIDLDCG